MPVWDYDPSIVPPAPEVPAEPVPETPPAEPEVPVEPAP